MSHISEYQAADRKKVVRLVLGIQQDEFNIPITEEEQPDLAEIPGFYRL